MTNKLSKLHKNFYLQYPLIRGDIALKDLLCKLVGSDRETIESEAKIVGRAIKNVAKKGSFYFTELFKSRKQEREQIRLEYHLLNMEINNPSKRFTKERTPDEVKEGARAIYDFIKKEYPNLSLKQVMGKNKVIAWSFYGIKPESLESLYHLYD